MKKYVLDSYWKTIEDALFPIGSDHPSILECRRVKHEIVETLRSSPCKQWFVICCLIGEREEIAEPAVFVIANENVDMPYESKDGIKVKFKLDEIGRFSPSYAVNAYYEQPIKAGSSCSGENDGPGTVGGFFTLPNGKIIGLTNAHVITHSSTVEGKIHQPAVDDYMFRINLLRESISNHNKSAIFDTYPGELEQHENLQISGGFLCGNYVHGRQERNPGQQTLDYAIFSIDPGRPNPTNQFPIVLQWRPTRLQPPKATLDQLAKKHTEVFKVGRSTGYTIGRLNNEMGLCLLDGIETEEYVVFGNFLIFARCGDSGSLLCYGDGAICGLIWGGSFDDNITFVTPIDLVLRSLKEDGYNLTVYEN